MTIGTGVFLSAALLGIIILFVATKDRWNWRRVAKWAIAAPLMLVSALVVGFWAYSWYEARPRLQAEFWGLKLSATQADVKFLKGEPSEIIDGGRWVYYELDPISKDVLSGYVVEWKSGAPRSVRYATAKANYRHPSMQGFEVGAAYEGVIKELGKPSHSATSTDGLERVISYAEYQTFYRFEKGELKSYGIYNPAIGPMDFAKPAAPASAPGG